MQQLFKQSSKFSSYVLSARTFVISRIGDTMLVLGGIVDITGRDGEGQLCDCYVCVLCCK